MGNTADLSKIENFISVASSVHSGKYDYSELFNLEFFSKRNKLPIICPDHGLFYQRGYDHLKGHGCKKCQYSNLDILKRKSLEDFISEASKIHDNKYDYSKFVYIESHTIGIITCPEHGDFEQEAAVHLKGHGCPRCSYEVRGNKSRKSSLHYANKLSGSNIRVLEYYFDKKQIEYNCIIHGTKINSVSSMFSNSWRCPDCIREENKKKLIANFYLKNTNSKYKIEENSYISSHSPVSLICPEHGNFIVNKAYYLTQNTCSCPKCLETKPESELLDFLDASNISYQKKARPKFLNGKELDIYVPEFNFAIEFNGSYWHSDIFRNKWYHFDKSKECIQNNVRLLHIWEHYWSDPVKKNIYLSKIRHFLNMDRRIYARKCQVTDISKEIYENFIATNHLEGNILPYKDMQYKGLYFNSELVMVAGIGLYYSQSEKLLKPKLQRICTILGTTVVGGVSRLVKSFNIPILQFQITLDTGGSLLDSVPEKGSTSLRYWWIKNNKYLTRNTTQVAFLKKNNDWLNTDTENSYMKRNGWYKLYDAGIITINVQ